MSKVEWSGRRNGRLVAIRLGGRRGGRLTVLCRCDCGNQHVISTGDFRKTKSCGCVKRQATMAAFAEEEGRTGGEA
jgi:hypothetical protein